MRQQAYRESRRGKKLSQQDRKQKLRERNMSGLLDHRGSHVSVRSIQMRSQRGQQCPQKHVDTCSWPQCNRSCPKLHNPLTGMDGVTPNIYSSYHQVGLTPITSSYHLNDTCHDVKIINIVISGEEMDFLELLESFGLDMKSVAQALGIDISTLNNMDKDVLLHLLTSQTNVN